MNNADDIQCKVITVETSLFHSNVSLPEFRSTLLKLCSIKCQLFAFVRVMMTSMGFTT